MEDVQLGSKYTSDTHPTQKQLFIIIYSKKLCEISKKAPIVQSVFRKLLALDQELQENWTPQWVFPKDMTSFLEQLLFKVSSGDCICVKQIFLKGLEMF